MGFLVCLLDAFLGVPGALQLAHVEDLAGVIRIVGADVGEDVCLFGEGGVVGVLEEVFEIGQDGVEVVDGLVPGGGVEAVEGFFVH